jgi:hypothetical protein
MELTLLLSRRRSSGPKHVPGTAMDTKMQDHQLRYIFTIHGDFDGNALLRD